MGGNFAQASASCSEESAQEAAFAQEVARRFIARGIRPSL